MYYYRANALALGGRIRRPLEQVIESQAASSLPSSGGFSSSRVENFNFKDIVSFRAAHTEVTGSEIEEKDQSIHTARVSVIVEGLNILNVVTADKVIARLASRHLAKDDEPAIITTGSYFENLKIAGHAVEVVEFAHGLFHTCDTYEKFSNAFRTPAEEKKEPLKERDRSLERKVTPPTREDVLNSHLGRHVSEAPANISHPACVQHLKSRFDELRNAKQLPPKVVCSVIKEISLKPAEKEVQIHGPLIVVPHFGVIILGELIFEYGAKRLNMLRVELGSPDGGALVCASGDGNGGGG